MHMTQRVSCSVCIQRETRILTKLMTVLLKYTVPSHSTEYEARNEVCTSERASSTLTMNTQERRAQHDAIGWLAFIRFGRSVECSICWACVYVCTCVRACECIMIPLLTMFVMNDYHWEFCVYVLDGDNHNIASCAQKQTMSSLSVTLLPLFLSLFIHYMLGTWCVTSCVWFECKMKEAAWFHLYDEAGPIE